jgi:hypothetical protein
MVIDHGKYYDVGNWTWSTKIAWLPAKMDSGQLVWCQEYYHGVRFIFGPAGEDPVILHQYMTKEEFTWSALKNS